MGSDKIKDALVDAFPGTSAKDWKRRTKSKQDAYTRRDFEHPIKGTVTTLEDLNGHVLVDSEPSAESLAEIPEVTDFSGFKLRKSVVSGPLSNGEHDVLTQAMGSDYADEIKGELERIHAPDSIIDPDTIKSGDRIALPAGTAVYRYTEYGGGAVSQRTPSKGEEHTVVSIVGVGNFLSLASTKTLQELAALMHEAEAKGPFGQKANMIDYGKQISGREGAYGDAQWLLGWMRDEDADPKRRPYWLQRHQPLIDRIEEARQEVIATWGDPRFAMWGTTHDRRVALVSACIKIADKSQVVLKAAPKKAEQAITKRRLMVEGSMWRFPNDLDVKLWVPNPEREDLLDKAREIERLNTRRHAQHRVGNTVYIGGGMVGRENTKEELAQISALKSQAKPLPAQVEVPAIRITAGTVIEVRGKLTADGMYSYGDKKTNGLMVPFSVVSGSVKRIEGVKIERSYYGPQLPYKRIEKFVEADSIPESIVYVLRDTNTGDYFGGWETEHNGNYNSQTNEPKMSSTFSGAKKYKTSSACKASIRDFTGYNSGLDDEGGAAEWVGIGDNNKKMDLPQTWEMVAIDKTTNAEKEVIDVVNWYNGLTRLRVLTQSHGSAVRAAYKKAEGKEGIEAILLFSHVVKGRDYKGEAYAERTPWDDCQDRGKSALAAVDAAISDFAEKSFKAKSPATVAVACSFEDGALGKMSINHRDVDAKLFDINTLEEIVDKQTASA